jgi:hypothetical protein
MSPWIDVRDWLGGYPYEFSPADEIFRFCSRERGFTLVNLRTVNRLALNEFLFHRSPQYPLRRTRHRPRAGTETARRRT